MQRSPMPVDETRMNIDLAKLGKAMLSDKNRLRRWVAAQTRLRIIGGDEALLKALQRHREGR